MEREVAGLRCTEVLAVLSAYVDGELDADTRTRVDAHLAGCDWCEHFGGEFVGTIRQLRRTLVLRAPEGLAAKLFG